MAWETRSIYEIAVFFLSATQLISDHGTEELWGIQSTCIFRGEFHFILLGQYNNQIIIRQHCNTFCTAYVKISVKVLWMSFTTLICTAMSTTSWPTAWLWEFVLSLCSNLFTQLNWEVVGEKGGRVQVFLSLCSKITTLHRNLLVCLLLLEFGLHWFWFFSCFYVPLCSNNFKLHYVMPFFYFTAWFWFLEEFLYILRWHCSIFPGIFWTFCSVLQT